MIYRAQQEEERPARRARGHRRGGRGWWGWLAALVILLALAGGALWTVNFVRGEISGEGGAGTKLVLEVPDGATADDIAAMLEEAGVVKSKFVFRNWLRFFYTGEATFMYGPHEVSDSMDFETLTEALKTPMVSPREWFSVTFPEGRTTLGMALDLVEKGVPFTVDEFLAAMNDEYDVPFFDRISSGEGRFIKLEGFLYPDTYEFYQDSTPQEIIQKMLENFDAKVFQDSALMGRVEASGYSLEEVITLASVIEKESGDPAEVYKVSSVFHNRLAEDSPFPALQSCATRNYVWYVLDYYFNELKGEPTPEELAYNYDTYESSGLVTGPICNPAALSIDAVLNPADTPYYFFLMDDTGKTYYGETYGEHLANIDSMVGVNAELAGGIGETGGLE